MIKTFKIILRDTFSDYKIKGTCFQYGKLTIDIYNGEELVAVFANDTVVGIMQVSEE